MDQHSINILRRICRGRALVYAIFVVFLGLMSAGLMAMDFFAVAVAFALTSVFFLLYLFKTLWLGSQVASLSLSSAEGYALIAEEIYHHTLPLVDVTRVSGKKQVLNRTVDIGGVKYLLPLGLSEPPEDRPIRIFYVTLKMCLFGGRFSRLILSHQLISETSLPRPLPKDLTDNMLGRLSTAQIRALRLDKIKFYGLFVGISFPLGVGLLYGFSIWSRGELSWQAWSLGSLGGLALLVSLWIMVTLLGALRAIPKKSVQHFTGLLKKQATGTGARVDAGGYTLLHGTTRYGYFPDSLFQLIPQATEATYYWFDDDGTRTIINMKLMS